FVRIKLSGKSAPFVQHCHRDILGLLTFNLVYIHKARELILYSRPWQLWHVIQQFSEIPPK
ncbi:MAG: hypothetical protein DSY95_07155, partial [SAR324 cluster bacterium]